MLIQVSAHLQLTANLKIFVMRGSVQLVASVLPAPRQVLQTFQTLSAFTICHRALTL